MRASSGFLPTFICRGSLSPVSAITYHKTSQAPDSHHLPDLGKRTRDELQHHSHHASRFLLVHAH
jgi:hypothetical protein